MVVRHFKPNLCRHEGPRQGTVSVLCHSYLVPTHSSASSPSSPDLGGYSAPRSSRENGTRATKSFQPPFVDCFQELFPKLGYYFIVFKAIESERTRDRLDRLTRRSVDSLPATNLGVTGEDLIYLVVLRNGRGICTVRSPVLCRVLSLMSRSSTSQIFQVRIAFLS